MKEGGGALQATARSHHVGKDKDGTGGDFVCSTESEGAAVSLDNGSGDSEDSCKKEERIPTNERLKENVISEGDTSTPIGECPGLECDRLLQAEVVSQEHQCKLSLPQPKEANARTVEPSSEITAVSVCENAHIPGSSDRTSFEQTHVDERTPQDANANGEEDIRVACDSLSQEAQGRRNVVDQKESVTILFGEEVERPLLSREGDKCTLAEERLISTPEECNSSVDPLLHLNEAVAKSLEDQVSGTPNLENCKESLGNGTQGVVGPKLTEEASILEECASAVEADLKPKDREDEVRDELSSGLLREEEEEEEASKLEECASAVKADHEDGEDEVCDELSSKLLRGEGEASKLEECASAVKADHEDREDEVCDELSSKLLRGEGEASKLEVRASAVEAGREDKKYCEDEVSDEHSSGRLGEEEEDSSAAARTEESATRPEESVSFQFEDDTIGSILSADILKDDENCLKSDACESGVDKSEPQTKDENLSDVTAEEADAERNVVVAKEEESLLDVDDLKEKNGDCDDATEERKKNSEERVCLQHDLLADDGLSLESVSETSFTLNDNTEENDIEKETFSLKDEDTQDSTTGKECVDYKKDFLAELEDISSEDNEDFFADIEPVSTETNKYPIAKETFSMELNEESLSTKEVSESSLIEKRSEESSAVHEDFGAERLDENEESGAAKEAFLLEDNEDTLAGVEAISSDDNEDSVSVKEGVSSGKNESCGAEVEESNEFSGEKVASDELSAKVIDNCKAVQESISFEDSTKSFAEKEEGLENDEFRVAGIRTLSVGSAVKSDLSTENDLPVKEAVSKDSANFVCGVNRPVSTEVRMNDVAEENSSGSTAEPVTEDGTAPGKSLPITKLSPERESVCLNDVDNTEESVPELFSPDISDHSESSLPTADEIEETRKEEVIGDAAEDQISRHSLAGTDNVSVDEDEQPSQSAFSTASNHDTSDALSFSDITCSPTVVQSDVNEASATNAKLNTSPALPLQDEESSTLPPEAGESCTLPPEVEESSTLPPEVEESSTLPPEVEESSTLPPEVEESCTLPPEAEESSTLPPEVEERSTLPPEVEESSTLPPELEESSTLPPEVEENPTPPPDVEESSTLPPEVEECSTLPFEAENSSTLPSDAENSPADSQDSTVLPSEKSESLDLLMENSAQRSGTEEILPSVHSTLKETSALPFEVQHLTLQREVEESAAVAFEAERSPSPTPSDSRDHSVGTDAAGELSAVPFEYKEQLQSDLSTDVEESLATPSEEGNVVPSGVENTRADVEGSLKVLSEVVESQAVLSEVVESQAVLSEVVESQAVPSEAEESLDAPTEVENCLAVPANVEKGLAEPAGLAEVLAAPAAIEESSVVPSDVEESLAVTSEVEESLAVLSEVEESVASPLAQEEYSSATSSEAPLEETTALPLAVDEISASPAEVPRSSISTATDNSASTPKLEETSPSLPEVEEKSALTLELPVEESSALSLAPEENLAPASPVEKCSALPLPTEKNSVALPDIAEGDSSAIAPDVEESSSSSAAVDDALASPPGVEDISPNDVKESLLEACEEKEDLALPVSVEKTTLVTVEESSASAASVAEDSALPSEEDESPELSSEVEESSAVPSATEESSASPPAVDETPLDAEKSLVSREESSELPSDVEKISPQPQSGTCESSVPVSSEEFQPSADVHPAEVASQPTEVVSVGADNEQSLATEIPDTESNVSGEASVADLDKETTGVANEVVSEPLPAAIKEISQRSAEKTTGDVAAEVVEKPRSKLVKKERCPVEEELPLESLKQEELDIPSEPVDEDDIDAPEDLLDKDDSSYMKMEATTERDIDSFEESDLVIDEGDDPPLPDDSAILKSEAIKMTLGSEVSIKLVPTKSSSEPKPKIKKPQSVSIIPKENLLKTAESLKRSLIAQSLVQTIAPTPKATKSLPKAPVPDLTPLQSDLSKGTAKSAGRGKAASLLKNSEQNATVKSLLKGPSPAGPSGNWSKGKNAARSKEDFRPFPSLPKDTVVIPTYYVPEQEKGNPSQPMNLSTSNDVPAISKTIPASQPLPANVVPSQRQRASKSASSRAQTNKNAPVPPPLPLGAMMPNIDPNMFPSMWSLFGPQLLSSQFLAAAAGASGTLPPFPLDPQKQNLLGAMLAASSSMPRLQMPPPPELNVYNTALMQMQAQMDAFLPPHLQEQMPNAPLPPDMNRYNAALMQMQAQMDAFMPHQMALPPGAAQMPAGVAPPPVPSAVPPFAKTKSTPPTKPPTKPQATILPQPKVPPKPAVQQVNVGQSPGDPKTGQPAVARKPGGRNTKFTPGSSPRLVKRPTSAAATAVAAALKIPVPAVSAAPRPLATGASNPSSPVPAASTPPAPAPPAVSKKFKLGSKLNSVVDKLLAGASKQGGAVDLSGTAPRAKRSSPVPPRKDTPPLKEVPPVKKVIQVTNALTIELDSRERRVRPPMPALLPCKPADPSPNPCDVLLVEDAAKKARVTAVNGCVSDLVSDSPQVLTPEQARKRQEMTASAVGDDPMSVTCSLPLDKVSVMFDPAKKSSGPSCSGLPTLPPTLAAGGLEILPMEIASTATSTPKQVVSAPPIGANSISLGSNVSLTLTHTVASQESETPLEDLSAIEACSPVAEEDPTPSPPQLEPVSSPLKRAPGPQDGETSSPDKEVPSLDLEVPEGLDSTQKVPEEILPESTPVAPEKAVASRKKFSFAAHSSFMMTLSDGQKLFTCDICSGVYQRAFSLKRHYLRSHINYIHLHERDISNCGIIVGNKMAVQTEPHTKVCLKDSKITVVSTDEESEEAKNARTETETNELGLPGLYRCFTCGVCFDLKDQLRTHLQEHKPTGDPEEGNPKETLFTCEICSYPFRHKKNYLRHLEVCQKRKLTSDQSEWLCLFCNKTFQSAAVRSRHLGCIHKRIRPGLKKSRRSKVQKHTCMYCGTSGPKFNDLNSLLKHMIVSHEDVYFGCLLCEERYPSKSALQEHTNETHIQDVASSESVPEALATVEATREDVSTDVSAVDVPPIEATPVDDSPADTETSVPVSEPEPIVAAETIPAEPKAKASSKKSDAFQFVCSVCKKMFVSDMNMKRHKQLAHGGPRGKKKRRAGNAAQPPAAAPNPETKRKEAEAKLDPEALFYSRLSMQIRENLMHHLDGKLDSQELFEREEQEPLVVKHETFPPPAAPNPASTPQEPPDVVDINKVKNIPRRRSSESYLRLTWDKFNINKDKDSRSSVSSFIRDMSHIDIPTQLIMRRNMKRLSEKDSSKCVQSNDDARRLEYPSCIALVQSTEGSQSLETATPESLLSSMLSVTARLESEPSTSTAPPPPKLPLNPAEDFLNGPWKNRDLSNEVVDLSGEWVRPKYYLCAACDSAFLDNLYEMEDHLYQSHPNVWGTYWEFEESTLIPFKAAGIKSPSSLYQRSLQPMGSLISAPEQPASQTKDFACTKCSRVNNSLPELHRHMLDCGGDTTWHLTMILSSPINGRRNRKWRPFGSRRRRQQGRRGLKRNIPNTPQRPKTNQPKTRGGDAETIQRMIANLPAKRSTRRVIQFKEDEVKTRSQATMASTRLLRKRFKVQFPVSQSPLHKASRAILGRSMATSSSKPGHMPRARPLRTSTPGTSATTTSTPKKVDTPRKVETSKKVEAAKKGETPKKVENPKKIESPPKTPAEPEVVHTMVQVQTLIPAKVKKAALKLARAAEASAKAGKEKTSPNTSVEALASTSKKAMSMENIPEGLLDDKASPGKGEKTTDVILEAMRKAMLSTNVHLCNFCGRMFNNSGNRDRHSRVCSAQGEEGMPRLRKEASAPRSRQTSKNTDIPVLSPSAAVTSMAAEVEAAKTGESAQELPAGEEQSASGKKKKKRTIVGIRKSLVKSEEGGGGMVVTESFLVRVDSSSNELSETETKDKAVEDLLNDVFENKDAEIPLPKKKEPKKKATRKSKVEAIVEAPAEEKKKKTKKVVSEEAPVKKLTRSKQTSPQKVPVMRVDRSANPEIVVSGVEVAVPGTVEGIPGDVPPVVDADNLDFEELLDIMDAEEVKQLDMIVAETPSSDADDDIPLGEKLPIWKKEAEDQSPLKPKKGAKRRGVDVVMPPAKKSRRNSFLAEELVEAIEVDAEELSPKGRPAPTKGRKKSVQDAPTLMLPPILIPEESPRSATKSRRRSSVIKVDASPVLPAELGFAEEQKAESVPVKGKKKKAKPADDVADVIETAEVVGQVTAAKKKTKTSKQSESVIESDSDASEVTPVTKKKSKGAKALEAVEAALLEEVESDSTESFVSTGKKKTKAAKQAENVSLMLVSDEMENTPVSKKKAKKGKVLEMVEQKLVEEVKPALKKKSKGTAVALEEDFPAEPELADVLAVSKKKSKATKPVEVIQSGESLANEPKTATKKKTKIPKTTENMEGTVVVKVKAVSKRKSKGAVKPVENVPELEPASLIEAVPAEVRNEISVAAVSPVLSPTLKKKMKGVTKASENMMPEPEPVPEAVPETGAVSSLVPVTIPVTPAVLTASTPVTKKKSKGAAKVVKNLQEPKLDRVPQGEVASAGEILAEIPASTPVSKKKSKAAAAKAAENLLESKPEAVEQEEAASVGAITAEISAEPAVLTPASKKKSKAAKAAEILLEPKPEATQQEEAASSGIQAEAPAESAVYTPLLSPVSKKKSKAAAAKAAENLAEPKPEAVELEEAPSVGAIPAEISAEPAVLTPVSTCVSKKKSKAAAAKALETLSELKPETVQQEETASDGAIPAEIPVELGVLVPASTPVSKKKSKAAAAKAAENAPELELESTAPLSPTPKKKTKATPKTIEATEELDSENAGTRKKSKVTPKPANKVIEPDPNLVGELTPRNRKRIQPLEGETKKTKPKPADKPENPASPAVVSPDVPAPSPVATKKGKVGEESATSTKEATPPKEPTDQPVKRKSKKRAVMQPTEDSEEQVSVPMEGAIPKVNRKRPRSSIGEDATKPAAKGRAKKKAKLELDETVDSPSAEVSDETPEKAKTPKKKGIVQTEGEESPVVLVSDPGMPTPVQAAAKPKKKSKPSKISLESVQVSDEVLKTESVTPVDQVKSSEFAAAPTPTTPTDQLAANSPTPAEQPDITPKKRKSSIGSQFFCDLCQRHYSTAYNLTKHLSSLSHRALLRGTQTSEDSKSINKDKASPMVEKTESVIETNNLKAPPFLEIAKEPVTCDNVESSSSVNDKADAAVSESAGMEDETPLVQAEETLIPDKHIEERPVLQPTPMEVETLESVQVLQSDEVVPEKPVVPKEQEQLELKTSAPELTPLGSVPEDEGPPPVPNPAQASLVLPQDQSQFPQSYPAPLQEIHHQGYTQEQQYHPVQQYHCYENRNWQGDSGWGPWRIPDAGEEISNNMGFGLGSILDSVNQVLAGDGGVSSDLPDSLYAGYALNEIQNAVGATDEEMAVLRQLGEGSFEELVGAPGSVMWPLAEETQLLDLDNQRPSQPPESEKTPAETSLTPLTSRKSAKSPAQSTSGTPTPSKIPNNTEAIPSTSSRDDTRSPVSMLPRPKTGPAGGNSLNELYEDRQMWCPSCHRRFLGLQAMKAHMAQHHSQNQRVERKATLSAEGSSEHRIICEVCREMVVDQVALELHMEELHSGHNDPSKAVPASPSPGAKSRVLRMQMSHALGGLLDRALKNYLSKATTGAASSVDTDRSRFTLGLLNKLALRHQANSANQRESPRATPNPSETDGDAASSHSGSTTPTNMGPRRRNSRTEPMFVQYQGHPCPHCPEKFMSDAFVKRHINNVHANLLTPEPTEDNLSDAESRPGSPMEFCADPVVGDDGAFLCSSCGINFKSPSEVLEHQRAEHQPTAEEVAQSALEHEERMKPDTPVMRFSENPDPKADDDVDSAEIAEKISEFQQRVANPLKGRSLLTKDLKNKKIALAVESAMLEHTAEVQLVAEAALRELGPCRKSSKSSTKESPKWGIDAVKFTVAKEPALVGAYGPVPEQESRLRNIPIVRKTPSSAPRFSFAERKKFARPSTEVKPVKEKMEIYEFDESPKVEPLTLELKREVEDVPEKTLKNETLNKEVEIVEKRSEASEVEVETQPVDESPVKSETEVTTKGVAKKKQISAKKKDEEESGSKTGKTEKKKIFKKRKSDQESGKIGEGVKSRTPKSDESAGRARKQRRASTHDATDYSVFDFSSDESSMGAAVDVSGEVTATPTSPRARRENVSPPKKASTSRVQELLEEDWTWLDDSESEKEKRKKLARRKRSKKKEKCGDSPKKPAVSRESKDNSDMDTSEESKKAEEGSGVASASKRRKRSEMAGSSIEAAR